MNQCLFCESTKEITVARAGRDTNFYLCKACGDSLQKCSRCAGTFHPKHLYTVNKSKGMCVGCALSLGYIEKDGVLIKGKKTDKPFFGDRNPYVLVHYSPTKGKLYTHKEYIGMEIEAEAGVNARKSFIHLPAYFGLGHDGTLHKGVEIQTPPANGAIAEKFIIKACEELEKAGYVIKDSCGGHVHLSCDGLLESVHDLKRFVSLHFYTQHTLQRWMLPKSRYENRYANIMPEGNYTTLQKAEDIMGFMDLFYDLAPDNFGSELIDKISYSRNRRVDDIRYRALNLHSMFFRKTVEVRSMEGSLDPRRWLSWAEFHASLIQASKSKGLTDSLIEIGKESPRLLQDRLDNIRRFLDLLDMSKESRNCLLGYAALFLEVELPESARKQEVEERKSAEETLAKSQKIDPSRVLENLKSLPISLSNNPYF